jgi:hypothetical protein
MESIDDLVKRVARELGALPCPCCGAEPMALRMTAVFPPDEDTARLGSAIACSNEACRLLVGYQWEMEDEHPGEQPGAMDRALEAWNQRSVEQALRVLVSAMRARGACQDRSMCLTIDDGCVAIGIQGMPRLAGFEQVSRWLEGESPDVFGGFTREPDEVTAYALDEGQPAGEAKFPGTSVDAPQMWVVSDAVARVHVVPARPPALTFASPEDEARWKAAQETHVVMLLKMSGERT